MIWNHRFFLLGIIQVSLLLLKQGNAQNQQVPNHENLPFHLYDNGTMVEFPSIPALHGVSLNVSNIIYESHTLQVEDPEHCLPRLFLQRGLYNSSNIYPLEYDPDMTENVTFFNCSLASLKYSSHYCPILAFGSHDSVLSENLVSCSMISRLLPSPVPGGSLQSNSLELRWIQPKVENSKISKILKIVLPSGTGSNSPGFVVRSVLLHIPLLHKERT